MMSKGIVHSIQWCDTRDMTADGHTKGSIDRDGILQVMAGRQKFVHEVKRYTPYRGATARDESHYIVAGGQSACSLAADSTDAWQQANLSH